MESFSNADVDMDIDVIEGNIVSYLSFEINLNNIGCIT